MRNDTTLLLVATSLHKRAFFELQLMLRENLVFTVPGFFLSRIIGITFTVGYVSMLSFSSKHLALIGSL
jgi:hypothetical protein